MENSKQNPNRFRTPASFFEFLDNQPHPDYKGDPTETPEGFSQTLDWFPSDTEKTWLINLHEREHLRDVVEHYKKNPIVYRINNFGYRTDYNFKKGDSVNVFLGCSYTFGVGINFEDTWVYKVGSKYDLPIANLGIGGTSINTSYRQLMYFKDFFKIQNIFHYQPVYARFEYFKNRKVHHFIVDSEPEGFDTVFNKEYVNNIILNDATVYYNHQVHYDAIMNVAHTIGANYYYIHKAQVVDVARDLGHYGPITNTLLADRFIKKAKQGSDIEVKNQYTKPTLI